MFFFRLHLILLISVMFCHFFLKTNFSVTNNVFRGIKSLNAVMHELGSKPFIWGCGGGEGVAIRITTIDNMVVVVREIVFASISHI